VALAQSVRYCKPRAKPPWTNGNGFHFFALVDGRKEQEAESRAALETIPPDSRRETIAMKGSSSSKKASSSAAAAAAATTTTPTRTILSPGPTDVSAGHEGERRQAALLLVVFLSQQPRARSKETIFF
jgi:hypothetical protein